MQRTWSTLIRTAEVGDTQVFMKHDPTAMGWSVGDEVALTTTSTTHGNSPHRGLKTTIAAIGPAADWDTVANGPAPTVITLADPLGHPMLGGVTVAGEHFDKTGEVCGVAFGPSLCCFIWERTSSLHHGELIQC